MCIENSFAKHLSHLLSIFCTNGSKHTEEMHFFYYKFECTQRSYIQRTVYLFRIPGMIECVVLMQIKNFCISVVQDITMWLDRNTDQNRTSKSMIWWVIFLPRQKKIYFLLLKKSCQMMVAVTDYPSSNLMMCFKNNNIKIMEMEVILDILCVTQWCVIMLFFLHKINKEEHYDLWMGRCEKNFLNDASAGYYETETCNKTWGEWLFIWCGKKMWYMFFLDCCRIWCTSRDSYYF